MCCWQEHHLMSVSMNTRQFILFYLADLLTIEHHKPSPKPTKQEKKLAEWYYHGESAVKGTDESFVGFVPQ